MRESVSKGGQELLRATDLSRLDKAPFAWRYENLRIVPKAKAIEIPTITMAPMDGTQNAHLWQWWEGTPFDGQLHVEVSLKARGDRGHVGVNIYLHYHPSDDNDRQVYQIQAQCNDTWECLHKVIPLGDRPVYRIRLMVVARSGAHSFTLNYASLRSDGSKADERSNLIAPTYQDAVHAMVARHPSAGDAAFREKLTRYLLGANPKGMRTVDTIAKRIHPLGISFQGARFLDLGSGTGGALVGALHAGAAYCEGWEINEEKRKLSAINLDSSGVSGDFIVRSQSMEAPDALGDEFRPFEIVFCEEVLEHVKDLSAAIATLGRCIGAEKGVGYVTMPNGFAFQSVLADPHLQLFGISLLDRFEAQPMATALKNHTHYAQMMGTYCRYEDYVAQFRAVGLELTPLEIPAVTGAAFGPMEKDLRAIEARHGGLVAEWGAVLDTATIELLDCRLEEYVRRARRRLTTAKSSRATEAEKLGVARDYGQAHFAFLVQHAPGEAQR